MSRYEREVERIVNRWFAVGFLIVIVLIIGFLAWSQS